LRALDRAVRSSTRSPPFICWQVKTRRDADRSHRHRHPSPVTVTGGVALNAWAGVTRGFQFAPFIAQSLFLGFVLATVQLAWPRRRSLGLDDRISTGWEAAVGPASDAMPSQS